MKFNNLYKKILLPICILAITTSYAQQRPNVIVIYSDDQGAIDLNCYGAKDLLTPNIDKFAASGTMFTQFYASPVCSPSRASLLTGLNPQRAGLPGNASETNGDVGLPNFFASVTSVSGLLVTDER
jgi:arylsulfatase A-like enzyme